MRRRIFALSGSSQLVPALACAERYGEGQSSSYFDDSLVLYGLARRLNSWQRIVYFSKREVRSLSRMPRSAAIARMRTRLGLVDADELYLNCVPHHCGGLLSAAYPQATGISYPKLIDELVALAVERHRRRAQHRRVGR